jgi:hypothetical protein
MFVVGFKDERVKVVVRTKERRERSMVQLVEAAIQK